MEGRPYEHKIPSRSAGKSAFLLLGIFTLIVVVYSNTFQNDFIDLDDHTNVYENIYIRDLNLENLKIWFSRPLLAMYTPLVYLSYAVDYRIGQLNPAAYHATNLLLHLINTALVFFSVRLMTQRIAAAALIAVIFAVHPMNAAAVTPVSVRSSLLYTMFYLSAFISYLIYLKNGCAEKKYLVLAAAFFLLSLLSKSAAVVFPLLMLLTDWYYDRKFDRKVIAEKVPFFTLSLLIGIVTVAFREDTRLGSDNVFDVMDRVFLASHSLVFYIVKFVAPFNLSAYYPYPNKIAGMLRMEFYAAPVILLVMAWGIAKAREYRKPLVYGIAFYLIHLALVLQVIPMGSEIVCDRYAYLPYLGLLFATVQVFHRYRKEGDVLRLKQPIVTALLLLTAGSVLLFSLMSFKRNSLWKDSYTFWTAIVQKNPDSAEVHRALGNTLRTDNRLDESIEQYETALSFKPYDIDTHLNFGVAYYLKGLTGQAITEFRTVLRLNPNNSLAHSNLGKALYDNGLIDEAVEHFQIAIKNNPDYAETYNRLGIAYVRKGLKDEAVESFRSAQRLDPYDSNYSSNLMKAYEIKNVPSGKK
jgi:tetratricopeptide (TPR) repeat protein